MTINIVLAGKGGVRKSMVACCLAQYFMSLERDLCGKSSAEFAQSRGVTPRYVRRALQTLRETGKIPALFEEGWKRKPRQPVNQVEVALALATNKAREGNQAIRSNSRCGRDIDAAAWKPECSSFE